MNTILEQTVPAKKTVAPASLLTPLAIILAGAAWILNLGMLAVVLMSTLPGIGLFMVLRKVQEEADQVSSSRS